MADGLSYTEQLKGCKSLMALTAKQRKFILEYLKDYNQTQAAIRAGYSAKTARSTASDYLAKPNIQAALAEVSEIVVNKDIADVQEIREFWTRVMRADIGEIIGWNEDGLTFTSDSDGMEKQTRRLIKRVKVTERKDPKGDWTETKTDIETHDPLKASEMLGRSHGIFIDKSEVKHSGEVHIQVVDFSKAEAS